MNMEDMPQPPSTHLRRIQNPIPNRDVIYGEQNEKEESSFLPR